MPKINPSPRPVWASKRVAYETTRVRKRWGGYARNDWRAFSKRFKQQHPICSTPGCKQPTYYTDHIIPVLDLIAQGRNPLDAAECQPLCYKCGNKKTGYEGKARQQGKAYDSGDGGG